MSLLYGKRVAEREVMDQTAEVEAYASAAASAHLDALDSRCADMLIDLGARPNWWLDIGCGPGEIACKVASRAPARIVALDLAFNMLRKARECVRKSGGRPRLFFVQADAAALPFRRDAFDLVYGNSLLHHLSHPWDFFEEAARVMRPEGRFFLRDLIRPLRWKMRKHIEFHGRYYAGQMRLLFEASVRAAYTIREVRRILRTTLLQDSHVSREGDCYLVIQR